MTTKARPSWKARQGRIKKKLRDEIARQAAEISRLRDVNERLREALAVSERSVRKRRAVA